MKQEEVHGYKLASRGKRLAATITEGVLYTIVIIGIYLLFGKSFSYYWEQDLELIDIPISAVTGLIVGAIFYPIFSGNLGHRIFDLKVISAETGKDINKGQEGAIREMLKYVLGYLLIPLIWLLWDDKKQNLYDKLSKTLVVEKV
ncbi:RDD family protein [Salegentibacter sp. BLCTC]|uniref:RDD family protein n=1 Tax=Salegentibacter maritimus TaxID=2794347 RepID=A0ABS0TGS6_9FLAO|nr:MULTISPECIES: RDD family protein [Salegentibacter]MBE7641190.1 RDD family protein [Salegentibacter sp. BLCTC]MBI6120233.1 RDD family protein [Salegentibacter maritimus]